MRPQSQRGLDGKGKVELGGGIEEKRCRGKGDVKCASAKRKTKRSTLGLVIAVADAEVKMDVIFVGFVEKMHAFLVLATMHLRE